MTTYNLRIFLTMRVHDSLPRQNGKLITQQGAGMPRSLAGSALRQSCRTPESPLLTPPIWVGKHSSVKLSDTLPPL